MSRRRAFSVLAAVLVACVATGFAERRPPVAVVPPRAPTRHDAEPRVSASLPLPLRVRASRPFRVVPQAHGPSRIVGLVRHADGTPAPGVELGYFALPSRADDEDAEATRSTDTTDADGSFSIEVGPGDYALYASDASRASQLLSPVSVSPGESVADLELVLDGPSVLAGVVVDRDGKPASARVQVSLDEPRLRFAGMSTTPDGRFRFPHLPNAPLRVRAIGRNEFEGHRELARPADDLILRLAHGTAALVCEVVDSNGAPVVGATVSVTCGKCGFYTSTDDLGRARVPGMHGTVQVSAKSDRGAADPVTVTVDDREQTVQIRLERAARVSGRVVEHEGRAFDGTLTLDTGKETSTVSVADGEYTLVALRAGRYRLAYGDPADVDASLSFATNGLDDLTLPDLRLPAARIIRGVVLNDEGRPVEDAEIDVVSLADGSFEIPSSTDEEGRFEVSVRGRTHLRATYDGATSALTTLSGSSDEEATLTLEKEGELIGMVRGVTPGAEVRCADGIWHPLEASGQFHLSCAVTGRLEVRDGGVTRSFAVDFGSDEPSYAELRWSPP